MLPASDPAGVVPAAAAVLTVSALSVEIEREQQRFCPVQALELEIAPGETFALLGESGCGKSMSALAIARLLPGAGQIVAGRVELEGEDLLALPEQAMRQVRGARIGMIFQEPGTSLNPVMTVAGQIAEALQRRHITGVAARQEAAALLAAVGIPDPEHRLDDYPHQLSGGMKQRVMIAIALAGQPRLLIADEPTTALDVTIQAQVLDLLAGLQRERGMAMLLITHDLGVVARMADQVGLMYAGQLVERGPRAAFFAHPLHPYARKLFAALPGRAQRGQALDAPSGSVPALSADFPGCRFVERCPFAFDRCDDEAPGWYHFGAQAVRCHLYADQQALQPGRQPVASAQEGLYVSSARRTRPVLEVAGLSVHFPVRKGLLQRTQASVRAVDGLSFSLAAGRTLALVGESGCGKTTVGKALLKLITLTAGKVSVDGNDVAVLDPAALVAFRRSVQMIFQDPFASLNPRMRVGEIIEEGMISLGIEVDPQQRRTRVEELLAHVGLEPAMRTRYPHEFSGGQRQRIAVARALAVAPRILICDEPTSALDVSVQAQLLNLMRALQQEHGLAYLFITHNIAVVEYLADEVAVMYLGRIVEQGPAEKVLAHPVHPYTRALLAAVPRIASTSGSDDVEQARRAAYRPAASTELPSPLNPPAGCHFHPRCAYASEICRRSYPAETILGQDHRFSCHWPRLSD